MVGCQKSKCSAYNRVRYAVTPMVVTNRQHDTEHVFEHFLHKQVA